MPPEIGGERPGIRDGVVVRLIGAKIVSVADEPRDGPSIIRARVRDDLVDVPKLEGVAHENGSAEVVTKFVRSFGLANVGCSETNERDKTHADHDRLLLHMDADLMVHLRR